MNKTLELLAPAGNADIGIAAIDHGADAVYVGAPRFSARANAGVAIKEIERLIQHAHFYYAKVYVALNTILTDVEVSSAQDTIHEIYDLGADGLIIQDPGLLELSLPPIPIIASTQMHNDTPEKIRFLEEVGFTRAILARELSLEEIAEIRRATTRIELESFVHGALCVSYSGQCYMSQAVAGRSGNRGVCAQPCRSPYTLTDADGNKILSEKFLLSVKDLNLMKDIPAMVAVGITSFKIEGRYKEMDYVRNVTAAYSRTLDAFIREHPGFQRCSSGKSVPMFEPDPAKTFNRGFTRYFISGRQEKIGSVDTPKSIGQPVGAVTGIGKGFFKTNCRDLQNGDGVCFFTKDRKLVGFRVDRVEGSRIIPNTMKDLTNGALLYRNYDIGFSRQLNRASGRREIQAEMDFRYDGNAIHLAVTDEDGNRAELIRDSPYEEPRDPDMARELLEKHLLSTGNTPFRAMGIHLSGRIGFFSIGFINSLKRDVLAELEKVRLENYHRESVALVPNAVPYPAEQLDYRANVYNEYARRFYVRHGVEVTESAFEAQSEISGREVMRTRYCLRYELDACPKFGRATRKLNEPLQISDAQHAYLLKFDCEACRMSLIFLGRRQANRNRMALS